jgi:hypothetical protein
VLTILFLLAGAVSLVGTLGIFNAWNWWLPYATLNFVVLQVFVGVLVTLAWISAAVILWLQLHWAVIYSSFVVILTSVWAWVERLVLTKNPLPFSRQALALTITCVFLLFVFSSLYLVAPSMKPFKPSHNDGGSTSIQPTGEKNE